MPAPQLYDPEHKAGWPTFEHPDQNLTLPQLWQLRVVPLIKIVEPAADQWLRKNRGHYRTALATWARIMGDVPAGAIDEQLLAAWRERMAQETNRHGQPLSLFTIRKHWRYIRAVLGRLHQLQVLPRVPAIKLARGVVAPGSKPLVTTATWNALCAACNAWHFSSSRHLPGPLVGRGVFIWFWSTGLRPADLWGLTWEDLRLDEACPVTRYSHVRSPWGWLYVEAAKTGKPTLVPLSQAARNWLEVAGQWLPARARTGPLLPVGDPSTRSFSDKERHFHRRAVCREARLDPPVEFRHLRDAACQAWDEAGDAGGWLLGHEQNYSVTSRHYRAGVRILAAAVQQLDTPATFLELVGAGGGHLKTARAIRQQQQDSQQPGRVSG